ncbi:uncharacterized protein Z519_05440 [Cladophialophora bantiana CBS 173.52]|uniref:Amidohydrolase-related domain-containing protein n=1 Tax=Cladophialophora bantiana (strain ATCC 10958 / CBS 173.52 / CDC B-1940 / NIH 8579) TaxID=1442370 RepID=A0A0D2IBC0_CLAB1|nr:uncharacterized protein Z519_05440 [Cladophialophora bantiana CBS 173.52]KIW94124.1 hypothetical protein Z519_05440 [Cladophialophora bantiana CBS 173.52]
MPGYLIKNGRVLRWDQERKSSFPQIDILVEGQVISKIGPNIEVNANDPSVQVIDASGCIVTPGFIDGHRHVFQSQLRSTVSNHTLLEYCAHLLQGRMTFLEPEDMYLSQLSGTSEAISCGVTTVMDHSHVVTTPDHAKRCIEATIESGIRSVYCASPFAIPTSLNPMTLPDMTVHHTKQIELFKSLWSQHPLGGPGNDGRVTLGLGFDTMHWIPEAEAREILTFVKDNNIPLTCHDVPRHNLPALAFLRDKSMPLPAQITLSHTCEPSAGEVEFVKAQQIGIVCTPESEMAMSHGMPSAFDFYRSPKCRVGLGVDSPAICSGDLFFPMRLALQQQRMRENSAFHARGKLPDLVPAHTDDVLYMATLGGAAAIHMESKIGSLDVGKCADVVLVRTDSPSMIGSVDFSAALVTHASSADVDTVMVNGELVKQSGKLLKVDWDELKVKLARNREALEQKFQKVDWERNKNDLKDLWGVRDVLE